MKLITLVLAVLTVLISCLISTPTAYADNSSFTLHGRAFAVVTTNRSDGVNSTTTTDIVARLSIDSELRDIAVRCPSGLISTYCTGSLWLGVCGKSTNYVTSYDFLTGETINITTITCTTANTGQCRMSAVEVLNANVISLISHVAQGGCQY